MLVMFVSISRKKGGGGPGVSTVKLSQLVYTKSVFIEEVDRTGSVLFETGTFFAPKSSSKRSFFLFKVTTDGCCQNSAGILFIYFFETKKLSFFA